MKTKLKKIISSTIILATFSVTANAAVIGYDTRTTFYTGVGVLDTTSRTWSSGGSFTLDSATITVSAPGWSTGAIGTPGISLFQNYIFGNNVGLRISGLDQTKTYNLAIFSGRTIDPVGANPRNNLGGTFILNEGTISGATTVVSSPNSTADGEYDNFTEGVNYVRFMGITPNASGNIRFIVPSPGNSILNGFEIQSVPEPSTTALLGLGGLALILRRRK